MKKYEVTIEKQPHGAYKYRITVTGPDGYEDTGSTDFYVAARFHAWVMMSIAPTQHKKKIEKNEIVYRKKF